MVCCHACAFACPWLDYSFAPHCHDGSGYSFAPHCHDLSAMQPDSRENLKNCDRVRFCVIILFVVSCHAMESVCC